MTEHNFLDLSRPNDLWVREGIKDWEPLSEFVNGLPIGKLPRIWKIHDLVWVTDWISTYFIACDEIPPFGSDASRNIINGRSTLDNYALRKLSQWMEGAVSGKLNGRTEAMIPSGSMAYFITTFDDLQDAVLFKMTSLADLMSEYPMVVYLDSSNDLILATPERSPVNQIFVSSS